MQNNHSSPGVIFAPTRRRMLQAAALVALSTGAASAAAPAGGARIGIGMHSYGEAWSAARKQLGNLKFHDAQSFLDYAISIKADGVQVAIGAADATVCRKLRATAETSGAYLEGQALLPKDPAEVPRFEAEVSAAKQAGAAIMRSVCMTGRRYEAFDTAEAFREAAGRSWTSLTLAEPVLKHHDMRLALENHKDWLIVEMLDLFRRLGSEFVGICVDVGNSLALLEDPLAVVKAYAPHAMSVHLKDIAVEMCDEGFLMSEVPLGQGMLPLPAMAAELLQHNPRINFNIEMITRDPLKIPCLTPRYWTTFETRRARELAEALQNIKKKAANKPLPRVSGLPVQSRLELEDQNVRDCLTDARRKLGL